MRLTRKQWMAVAVKLYCEVQKLKKEKSYGKYKQPKRKPKRNGSADVEPDIRPATGRRKRPVPKRVRK